MALGLVLMDPAAAPPPSSRTTPQWLQTIQQVTSAALPVLQRFAAASPVGGSPVSVEAGPVAPPVGPSPSLMPGVKNEHLLLGLGAASIYFFFIRGR